MWARFGEWGITSIPHLFLSAKLAHRAIFPWGWPCQRGGTVTSEVLIQHPETSTRPGERSSGTPPRRGSPPKGLTLVEVLVALAVFGVFAAGMAGLVIGLVNANANSKDRDAAVFLALDRLETIRNTSYPNIIPANFPTEEYGTITLGTPPNSYPDFQRSVSIQDNVPMAGLKRVVVTVSSRRGVRVTEEMVVGQ